MGMGLQRTVLRLDEMDAQRDGRFDGGRLCQTILPLRTFIKTENIQRVSFLDFDIVDSDTSRTVKMSTRGRDSARRALIFPAPL
jgi:hypothetical protein